MPSTTKFCPSPNRARRGAALAEFAVLLPVFVVLVLGVVYLGHLALVRQAVGRAARWALFAPGVQTPEEATARFFALHDPGAYWGAGGLSEWQDEAARWADADVGWALDEVAFDPQGEYEFDPVQGRVVFRLVMNEGPHARYIEDHALRGIAGEAEGELARWLERDRARAAFAYDPFNLSGRWAEPGAAPDAPAEPASAPLVGLGRTEVERGRHEGWGQAAFAPAAALELAGGLPPEPERDTRPFWEPR